MTIARRHLRTLPIVTLCLLVLGSAGALAQHKFLMSRSGRPEIKVMLSGVVEREEGRIPLEEAKTVKPGEVLGWTITSANEGDGPAQEYRTEGKIPPGSKFVAGSATADGSATVTYSIDNGKSFSAEPTIEVKQPDGSLKRVPAPLSMYTKIRYEWSDPLTQGGKLIASYKVRLN